MKGESILVFRFSVSSNTRKYLHSDCFYVRYDRPIQDLPQSILYIPGVAGLITLCWATNSDLYVEELDSNYLRSLEMIKEVMNKSFPRIEFRGSLICKRVVDNSFGNDGIGLLFSGGVDSTPLYIKHREVKPTLFSFIGGVTPIDNRDFIHRYKQVYSKFAKMEGVELCFIETDLREVLNEALLWSDNRDSLDLPWWELLNQGIAQISLCSPLTTSDIGTLKIASSGDLQVMWPYGTHPKIDDKIRWGDIRVLNAEGEINRQEKIKQNIKRFIDKEGIYPNLQVCNYNPQISDRFNCGYCEKCSRTIIGLLAEGIDPTRCGFNMRSGLYTYIKEDVIPYASHINHWMFIQELVDLEDNDFHQNSEAFLRWFTEVNLEAINNPVKGINIEKILLPIQARLPRNMQNKVLKAYYRWKYR